MEEEAAELNPCRLEPWLQRQVQPTFRDFGRRTGASTVARWDMPLEIVLRRKQI